MSKKAKNLHAVREGSKASELIHRVAHDKERVVVEFQGEESAALVPLEDLRILQQLEDRADLIEAQAVLAEVEREGTIPWEQLKKELSL